MGSRENRKSCVILAASSEKKTAAVGSGWPGRRRKLSRLRFKVKPSAISEYLDTGYSEFISTAGINGLAKFEGDTISLLAVNATKQRTGQFRKFINQAKRIFKQIEITEVWNPELQNALIRYGFSKDSDTFRWNNIDKPPD